MTRIGEHISERLDIVPAEFFVHRHIYGKWACRCCQVLRQAPSVAEVIEGGIAASGFSRAHADQPLRRPPAVLPASDHQRPQRRAHAALHAGVHGPARPVRRWSRCTRRTGASSSACAVLHADETPVALLDPGAGKTR
jgi:transposase